MIKHIVLTFKYCVWLMLVSIAGISVFIESSSARSRVEEMVDLMSLEQLMSIEANSTSFFNTPIEKTPGSLYVIPEEILDFSNAVSLADYLAYYVPGAHISAFYNKGPLYSTRGISGGSNNTALFMLNSEILNTSSGMSSNLNFPLLGYADRIEVLNGPCSLLHGSGAVNGFINIIHKNGKDHPGTFFSVESDLSNGQVRMETGYGVSDRFGDFYFYLGAVDSDSLDNPARAEDAFTEPGFRTSLNWNKENITVTAFAHEEKFESGLTSPFENTSTGFPLTVMKSYAVIPEFKADLTDTEDISISLPLKYFKQSQMSYRPHLVGSFDKEMQLKTSIVLKSTRMDDHRMAMGGTVTFYKKETDSLQHNFFSNFNMGNTGSSDIDLSLDLSWIELSAFMEDTIQLSNRLSLFTGIRFDSVHARNFLLSIDDAPESKVELEGDYNEIFTPRVGLTYELSPDRLLKFMYQQGYNFPDYAGLIKTNYIQEISTEKLQSFELGYHQSLSRSKGEFNLNAYYNVFKDTALQSYTENESDVYAQAPAIVDEFTAVGFEASLVLHPRKDIRIDASYSFSRPYRLDGDELKGSLTRTDGNQWVIYPAHMVKLNLLKTFFHNRLDIVLGCLYNNNISTPTEERNVSSSSMQQDIFNHHRFIVNAAARYRLTDTLSATLRGTNILGSEVPAVGYYYDWGYDGKNTAFTRPCISIGLDWKF